MPTSTLRGYTAPAEIDFLEVGDVFRIEQADLARGFEPQAEGRAAGPKKGYRAVVLTLVTLAGSEQASTAEGEAEEVDVAAAAAAVVKVVGIGG